MFERLKKGLLKLHEHDSEILSLSWKQKSYFTLAFDEFPSRELFYIFDVQLITKRGVLDFYQAERELGLKGQGFWTLPFPRVAELNNKQIILTIENNVMIRPL